MRVIGIYGPVGSGKSTLLEEIKPYIPNSFIIPEYIDALPDAETKLKEYLEGTISAYDFQQYVLDYFESVANELKNSSYDFIFVERLPVEGIQFFAKLDLMNKRITSEQYEALLKRAQSLTFYPDPSSIDSDQTITILTNHLSPFQISQKVLQCLLLPTGCFGDNRFHLQDVRIIKLKASLKTIKERINKRGRQCELEHYSDDYLKTMIEKYDS